MPRVSKGRIVLQDRALRVHAFGDARFFGRGAAWSLAVLLFCGVLGVAAPWSQGALLGLAVGVAGALVVALGVAAALIWLAAVWGAASRRASVRVSDALYIERAGRRMAIPLRSIRRARVRRGGRALTLAAEGGVVLTLSLADQAEARRLIEAIAAG
ncbi:MAG TPA: hypothetical protein VLS89_20885, partial [Candidatus Nanopelagicales bacterium]|nr:hypothetical protein [Candidatus Nanopelagicales bacterium]